MAYRDMSASMLTEIAKSEVRMAHLLKINFSTPLYFTDFDRDLTWSGDTYISDGNLISLSGQEENISVIVGSITMRLSGVAQANISLALSEDYTDVDVHLYRAFLNSSYLVISDPIEIFKGQINSWNIQENHEEGNSEVAWEISSHWAKWEEAGGRRSNNSSQKNLFPNDTGFSFTHESIKDLKWGRA